MACLQMSYQDTFKRISAVAHGIRTVCKTDNIPLSVPQSPTASTSHASQVLRLPFPEIPAVLESAPCSPDVKASIKAAFLQGAGRIRDNCQSKYSNMAKLLPSNPSKAASIIAFFERQYREQIVALEELTIAKVRQQPPHVDNSAKAKTVFNREFIPLLETYFNYNAYPSALDRATLARKSMMTPRQIEVWFQNHRNRAKKEGRPLKKLASDPLPLEISMKPLERKMSFFVIPEDQRQDPSCVPQPKEADLEAEVVTSEERDLAAKFNFHPPPHAFPSAYPPNCDYNPFPTRAGTYKFPAPIWYRTPATPRRLSKIAVKMDEFIEDFSIKLHLRVPALKQERQMQPCAGSMPALPILEADGTLPNRPCTLVPPPSLPIAKSILPAYNSRASSTPQQYPHSPKNRRPSQAHPQEHEHRTPPWKPRSIRGLATTLAVLFIYHHPLVVLTRIVRFRPASLLV
ncbi:hypothetical protein DXG03_000880 [Asterophora parasitica]|uniref:Homeobox domain-containing protein n=1 Tax=Asterophora parasitica TaxID=117018 RepID=A0A9P7K6H1_9AGAR|nr:hypothetical protein DXG03_000880 [Asterophora parasitica]